MKKILIIMVMLIACQAKAQTGTYSINGKSDMPANSKVYLNWFNIASGKHIDSASVGEDGRFMFKGSMQQAEIGQLILNTNAGKKSAVFYLEPGNINLDFLPGARYPALSGTPLNNDFRDFYAMLAPLLDSMDNTASLKGLKKNFDQFSPEINAQKTDILRRFVKGHPGSLLSIYQLTILSAKTTDPFILDSLYAMLSPAIKKTKPATELATRIKGMYSGKIGDTALPFSLSDTSGRVVNLSDFKGRYILLDFWATWCGPCMEEMPNISRANKLYRDKGLTVIGVSLDRPESRKKWLDVIHTGQLNWVQLSDLNFWNSRAALLYNVNSVPANFLIDPTGRIVAKNLRGKDLNEKLAQLLR